jgi:hypothetical protein
MKNVLWLLFVFGIALGTTGHPGPALLVTIVVTILVGFFNKVVAFFTRPMESFMKTFSLMFDSRFDPPGCGGAHLPQHVVPSGSVPETDWYEVTVKEEMSQQLTNTLKYASRAARQKAGL